MTFNHRMIGGLGLALLFSTAAFAQDDLINKVKDNGTSGAEAGFQFTTLVDLEATPVKNQGQSGTCWSYSTTSFLESEMIRKTGKSVDLSEMFTVRQVYLDKAEKYIRLHGFLNFGQGGALPDVLHVIKKYGAVPQEVYTGLNYGSDINQHGELETALKGILDAVVKNPNGKLSTAWRSAVEATLDAYLGPYPAEFKYNGKKYTPRSFADEVVGINPNDYVQLTSFTHEPYYETMMIEVPDNWTWGTSYNLPLEEMMDAVNGSLEAGYSVAWATDVSEKGFSIKNGLALAPAKPYKEMTAAEREAMFMGPQPELSVTPELRQAAYDNWETTDDHGMHFTGMVKDQNGTLYYIVKNSWGDLENRNKTGYLYASRAFVEYKTISVLVHKDSLPKSLRKKLNL